MKHLCACLVLMAIAVADLGNAVGQQPIQPQQFRPKWNVGDRWTVETQSLQQQVVAPQQRRVTAEWQFTVEAVDTVQSKSCWRIVVRPIDSPDPKTTIWVDRATTAIRQIQTQLPTPTGYKTVTESYVSTTGTPVVGPLSVMPIAIPQFTEPGIKDLDTFQYETISGPGGVKAIGDVGFSTEIRQQFSQPTAEQVKQVLGQEHLKGIVNRPMIEVKLTTPGETIHQIWAGKSPWPIFTENGTTRARLISSTRNTDTKNRAPESLPQTGTKTPQIMPSHDDRIKRLEESDGIEHGTASIKPWSGSWWPIRNGGLLLPLAKYDRLTGHRAAEWEKTHNPPGPNVPYWFGYCHAWAAASLLEREPYANRVFHLTSRKLDLGVGDQKGLLTACHTEDLANSWGDRFGDGEGNEDLQDLQPDRLWRLLKLHLGQQGVPLVLDVEAGKEVWNYPIYDYKISYCPINDGRYLANLALLMADDGVVPDYRGTKPRKQTYRFTFRMRGTSVIAGSGRWEGRSREDHPDFAWYPYKAMATNPEVKYSKVKKLVAGTAQPPSTEPAPVSPQPTVPVTPVSDSIPPADSTATPSQTAPSNESTTTAQTQIDGPIVLSPIELVALIANKTSSFEFDATLDRFDGATYRKGETYFMRVKSQRPGYLYLIQVDSTGTPSLIYPTAGENNQIKANKLIEIRPTGAAEGFPVAGPPGIIRIKSVVASRPLVLSGSLEMLVNRQQNILQQNQQQQKIGRQQVADGKVRQRQQTAKKQPTGVQQAIPIRPVQFRWHPTQRQQVVKLLSQDQIQASPEQLGCPKPQDLLGPFAQDMTTFYVGD